MTDHEIGHGHQPRDEHALPESAEVTGHETGQDRQRGAALTAGGDDFSHVLGLGRGEDLGELRDDRGGNRAAADDRGELPPEAAIAQIMDEEEAGEE